MAPGEEKRGEVENITIHEELDDAEKQELGETLARLTLDIADEENEKADVVAAFNSKLKTMNRQHHEGSQILNQGFRIEDRSAIVTVDIEKKKRIYQDPKTGKILKEEDLKPGDQPDLQF